VNALTPLVPTAPFMAPPDLMALAYIANNLREVDKREVFAGRITTPEQLTIEAFQTTGLCDVAWVHGRPAAAVGGRELWRGVWSVWAWGTDDWHDVKFTLTRHIIRTLVPAMLAHGGHRGECYSHEDHHEAHAWLEWLGFTCEGRLREYARDRSDFLIYAWRRHADVLQFWGRRRQLVADVPATARSAGTG